jgi:drug/metabolite transporter (DMT)-like permease
MNKILLGLLLGTVLGALDGASAWFTPEVRPEMMTIILGSSFKGLVGGVLIGLFARKVKSVPLGILFGLFIGALLAFAIAAMPDAITGKHYYKEIMIPGSLVGLVVGFATQKYGAVVQPKQA